MVLKRICGGLLAAGAVAGPLFAGIFTVPGARRAGYDARRQTVGSLALGLVGWQALAATAPVRITAGLYAAPHWEPGCPFRA